MVDSDHGRGSARPSDEESPDPHVEGGGSTAWSKLDVGRTEQGREDASPTVKGVRVVPVAGGLVGAAALGTIVGALRRRRSNSQAAIRAGRRKRTAGAAGAGALSALLGARKARSARRSR